MNREAKNAQHSITVFVEFNGTCVNPVTLLDEVGVGGHLELPMCNLGLDLQGMK